MSEQKPEGFPPNALDVAGALDDAWHLYEAMPGPKPHTIYMEFYRAIETCQRILALHIVREHYPNWGRDDRP